MNNLRRRIHKLESNLSGFKGEKDRRDAIRYLKTLDSTIDANDIQSYDDYMNEIKSFFAPLPDTPEYEAWLGTDQHKKYMKRRAV